MHNRTRRSFLETNPALVFDCKLALGRRLNVFSGASVRFELGEQKTATLANLGGKKHVVCGNRLTRGIAEENKWGLARSAYADAYGPITGDHVRLGDTNLIAQIKTDHTYYQDECKFGGGKQGIVSIWIW